MCEAIEQDNDEIIATLIDAGADVNFTSEEYLYDYIPLFIAVRKGNLKIVRYLIENGANIYLENQHKLNVLEQAELYYHEYYYENNQQLLEVLSYLKQLGIPSIYDTP